MKTLLFSLTAIFVLSTFVSANPPERIDINANNQRVEAFVSHPSNNPNQHYIKTIKVWLNGKDIILQAFTTQKPEGQTVFYAVPGLKKGDKVKVAAYCSVYGDLQKEATVD